MRWRPPGAQRRWSRASAGGAARLCVFGGEVRGEDGGEAPRGVCDWGGPAQGQRVTPQGRLRVARCSEVSVVDGCARVHVHQFGDAFGVKDVRPNGDPKLFHPVLFGCVCYQRVRRPLLASCHASSA